MNCNDTSFAVIFVARSFVTLREHCLNSGQMAPVTEGFCEPVARGVFRSKLSHSGLHQTCPQRNPKKVVVKPRGFPYFLQQMHRIGAGVNGIYPEMHVPKKYNNNKTTTNIGGTR
jgi:hypothetical protein